MGRNIRESNITVVLHNTLAYGGILHERKKFRSSCICLRDNYSLARVSYFNLEINRSYTRFTLSPPQFFVFFVNEAQYCTYLIRGNFELLSVFVLFVASTRWT